jgi:hypothetical protein
MGVFLYKRATIVRLHTGPALARRVGVQKEKDSKGTGKWKPSGRINPMRQPAMAGSLAGAPGS